MNRTPYVPIVPPPLPRNPAPPIPRDSPPTIPPLPTGFGTSPALRSQGAGPSSGLDGDGPWSSSGIRNRRQHPYGLRSRPTSGGNNTFEQLIHDDMDLFGDDQPHVSFPPSPMMDRPMSRESINESSVEQLVEMGFDREEVIQALIQSNNDVNSATNLLLS